MEGYIFKIRKGFTTHFYFVEDNSKRKSKKVATKFIEYFKKQLNGTSIPLYVWTNTYNKIYKEMYQAEIIHSINLKCYHIHEKNAGESIPEDALTIIK